MATSPNDERVKGQRSTLTGSNLFVFSTQRFLFISLYQNRVIGPPLAVWIKRTLAGDWFSQPTSSTPPQILGWHSFLKSLFSWGYLIVFTGSSEAPDSSLGVEAMFYHLLHPAWCYTQSWSQYWLIGQNCFPGKAEEPQEPVLYRRRPSREHGTCSLGPGI